jgi:hypothetical protein
MPHRKKNYDKFEAHYKANSGQQPHDSGVYPDDGGVQPIHDNIMAIK